MSRDPLDVDVWLRATFVSGAAVLARLAVPVTLVWCVYGWLASVLAARLGRDPSVVALADLADPDREAGAPVGELVLDALQAAAPTVALLLGLYMVAVWWSTAAAAVVADARHAGRVLPSTLDATLWGFRRLPAVAWATCVVLGVVLAGPGVVAGVVFAAGFAAAGVSVGVVAAFVALAAVTVPVVVVAGRLVLAPVVAALPGRRSPLRTAWTVTYRRWGLVVVRVVLVAVIAAAAGVVFSLFQMMFTFAVPAATLVAAVVVRVLASLVSVGVNVPAHTILVSELAGPPSSS